MNSWARKSVKVGVLSAGFLLAGTTAAHATDTTSNNAGILNGTQVDAMVQAPIDVCGNAIALLGTATAGCTGGSWATFNGELGDLNSMNNFGIGNGTQVRAFAQAPIDVCGNGVGVLGTASAWCVGGSWAMHNPAPKGHGHGPQGHGGYYVKESRTESASVEGYGPGHGMGPAGGPTVTTSNNAGILNGTQVYAPIQVPINVCGNAISLLGGTSSAGCQGGAHANLGEGGLPDAWTGLNFGIGNGTQILPIVQIPVNVCGNAVSVLATSSASCQGGADATIGNPPPHGHGPAPYGDPKPMVKPAHQPSHTASKAAKVKGKKAHTEGLPLVGELPLVGGLTGLADTVTGLADNLVGSAGQSQVNGGGLLGGLTGLAGMGGSMDSDSAMILPVVDRHGASGPGLGGHGLGGHGLAGDGQCLDASTSGNFGLLNGTQAVVLAQAPIDISGNAVGVAGDATAWSTGGATATLTC